MKKKTTKNLENNLSNKFETNQIKNWNNKPDIAYKS